VPKPNTTRDSAKDAIRLTVAVGRLRSRLREEAGTTSTGLSVTQLAVLQRIVDEGPVAASRLIAAEHVSQQAITQNLQTLKAARLISAKADPTDGRRSLVSATAAGRRLLEKILASRDAWLVHAIEAGIADEEHGDLERAIDLLERLADLERPSGRDS
jgi:DNA-binding MarR family transcriptional regulator